MDGQLDLKVVVCKLRENRTRVKQKILEYSKAIQSFNSEDEYSAGVRDTLKEVLKDLRGLL